jgi:hypothetical protein
MVGLLSIGTICGWLVDYLQSHSDDVYAFTSFRCCVIGKDIGGHETTIQGIYRSNKPFHSLVSEKEIKIGKSFGLSSGLSQAIDNPVFICYTSF